MGACSCKRAHIIPCSGPYATAILRFQIAFADDHPQRPPVITFQSDVFHPLVTPLTTYTYSTRDSGAGADPQSAADEQRLPPGGLSLRHGFPEWFETAGVAGNETTEHESSRASDDGVKQQSSVEHQRPPHVVELMQYLRIAFDTEEVLDSIPLDAAANAGAWHAWKSYRTKSTSGVTSVARSAGEVKQSNIQRSLSPRQQPGGARRPGEWNWQGVWEDRVRKSIYASVSEPVLFGGDKHDVVSIPVDSSLSIILTISPSKDQFCQTTTGGRRSAASHSASCMNCLFKRKCKLHPMEVHSAPSYFPFGIAGEIHTTGLSSSASVFPTKAPSS